MKNVYHILEQYLGGKRKETITKEELYMNMALLSSARSKDPNTQVGACYVSSDGKLLSIGYNGTPDGWLDDKFPWGNKEDDEKNTKYPYVIHAEMNGITSYKGPITDFKGSTIYVTLFPCQNCAKLLIQAGVKRIVYLIDDRQETEDNICTKTMLEQCGVEYISFQEIHDNDLRSINLSLDLPKNECIKLKKLQKYNI